MGITTENFNYTNGTWSNRYDTGYIYSGDGHLSMSSSGTSPITSSFYPINKVISVSGSTTGGWVWINTWNNGLIGNSIKSELTLSVYLVKNDGTKVKVASCTGSATAGGDSYDYNNATTNNCSYIITDSDKQNYVYAQLQYTVSTSRMRNSDNNLYPDPWNTSYRYGNSANPYGSSIITLRTSIPVNYNTQELDSLNYNDTDITSLKYNNVTIY